MSARGAFFAGCGLLLGCLASEPPPDYAKTMRRALASAASAGEEPARAAPRPPSLQSVRDSLGRGPLRVSIEEAVLLAAQQNKSLLAERLAPRVAGAYELIERGVFDPELFAELFYAREAATQTTDVTGERFAVESNADGVRAGVRQRLPTGTEVELAASRDRSVSSRRPEQYETRLGLTVTQSLLQGFGAAVNLVELRQAEAETLASAWELRGFAESLLAETESTYWRHVLAQRRIEIVERAVEVASQQLHEVEQFIAVGKLAPIEAAPLRAELALREQALIDARSELAVARLRLLRLLGAELGGQAREVVTTSEPRVQPAPIDDLDERLQLAERLRADLNEARLRVEQNRLQTVQTRNGLLPRLDLFITLGKSGYAASFGGAVEDIDGDSYDLLAGVELSYALGNRTARGLHRVAHTEQARARAAVANLRQLVELDLRIAASELERARQQIAASAATREFRDQGVRAEVERLRIGTGTALSLAQSQRDLLQSELDEVGAMIGYRLALVELYRAEGSLLERRGIRLAPP